MDPSNSNSTTSDDSTMTVTLYRRVLRSIASYDAPILRRRADKIVKQSICQSTHLLSKRPDESSWFLARELPFTYLGQLLVFLSDLAVLLF